MAMSISATSEDPVAEINTTPLIDVLLVLLIMLIITLPAMTHAIKVDTPHGGTAEPRPAIELAVDFDNLVLWNGEPVRDYAALEEMMRSAARSQPQPTVNVRADRRASYDAVAHVLGIAQRNGMQHLAIEGTP